MDFTSGNMTCALKVETQTPGWHKTLKKILKNIKGVSYSIDAERGIARLSGKIDPGKLLLILKKAAKYAELLWVNSGNHCGFYTDYHQYMNAYGNMETYPYQPGYYYSQSYDCPSYYPRSYDYPSYYPSYSYYEPIARYFPQPPPPPQNPRLHSFCNMM